MPKIKNSNATFWAIFKPCAPNQKFSSSILKKTWENQLSFSCFALLRLIWKFRHKLDLRFSSMKICQTSSFSESSKSKAINWCIFEDSHQFLSKPRLLHNKNSQGLWPKQKIVLVSLALLRFYAKNVMRKLILWQVFSHMFFWNWLDWIYHRKRHFTALIFLDDALVKRNF